MVSRRTVILLVFMNLALLVAFAFREIGVAAMPELASPAFAQPSAPARETRRESGVSRTTSRRTEITDAAERVSPSIVSVGASRTTYMVSPFADFFQRYSVYPYQEKIPYLGSGVIVSGDGLVVTNHHVIAQATDVFVTLMDGREVPAKVVDSDPALDIAVLRVNATNLKAVPLGDSDSILVGEWALAMGNPFGNLIGDPHPTVTLGVVSATRRSFRGAADSGRIYNDMIQTDAAINPGNSGGALINSAGELIGLNTFIMSRSGGSEGVGFAIPVNRVKGVLAEVREFNRIRARMRDFAVQNLTERLGRTLGTKVAQGAVVSEMLRRGPAAAAGLDVGDVIVAVDGKPVRDAAELNSMLWGRPVGTRVGIEADRGGRKVRVEYQLNELVER